MYGHGGGTHLDQLPDVVGPIVTDSIKRSAVDQQIIQHDVNPSTE